MKGIEDESYATVATETVVEEDEVIANAGVESTPKWYEQLFYKTKE